MLRALFIGLSESKSLRHFAERSAMGQKMSRRFVAGTTVEELLRATEAVNKLGIRVSVDNLGENVTSRDEALHSRDLYHQLLEEINKRKLDANVSLKLTHMGLDIDEKLARDIVNELLAHAVTINSFIRIDMEGSPYTDETLSIWQTLWGLGHRRLGVVLQSALKRSEDDARRVIEQGGRIRLVKGAYKEPKAIAWQAKADVDAAFVRMMQALLKDGTYPAIATHDPAMIAATKEYARGIGLGHDRFEFQMLYGVRRDLQASLVAEGYRVRVYIPFGREWFPYFMRRLGERPANALFVLKSILRER